MLEKCATGEETSTFLDPINVGVCFDDFESFVETGSLGLLDRKQWQLKL